MNHTNNMNMEKSTKKNMLKTTCKYALIAALAALTAFNALKFLQTRRYIEDISSPTSANTQKESQAYIEAKIKSNIKYYNSKQARIVESYRSKIHATIERKFKQAERGTVKFSENLGSYTYLAKLSYHFASDIVSGDNSAEMEIHNKISELISSHINEASQEVEALRLSCYQELAENHTMLKLEIENLSKPLPSSNFIKMRMKDLEDTMAKIEIETMKQAQSLSIMLIIEGSFANKTYHALKALLKPVITKIGVGAGAVAADGPLPLGDIITLGCAAWTLYDLYDIKFIAPEKTKENLISELNLQKNNLLSKIDKNLDAMAEAFNQ